MRKGKTTNASHEFRKDDLVLLEATNLQTTHPKAKLAPRRYGPFKVLWATPTNCKLELPTTMKIHPMFHNSLLKPYVETFHHGPNYLCPPPDIVEGEEGHYEIEQILASRPTRNRKSTQYLVKWKGYPDSENSWLPTKELTHAKELLHQFENRQKQVRALQAQREPKEGVLSRLRQEVAPATLINKPTIPRNITLKQYQSPRLKKPVPQVRSYSQVVKLGLKSHDTGGHLLKSRDPSRAQSHDPSRDTPESSRSRDSSGLSTCLGDHKTVKQPGGKNPPK